MFEKTKVLNIIPADNWWFVSITGTHLNKHWIVEPVVSWAMVEKRKNISKTEVYVEGLGCVSDDGYVTLVEDTGAFRGYVRATSQEEALKKAKEIYKT